MFFSEKTRTHHKHTRSYSSLKGLKAQIKDNAKIGLLYYCDFQKKNSRLSGRPIKNEETKILAIINLDHHSTTYGIAGKLNISHT